VTLKNGSTFGQRDTFVLTLLMLTPLSTVVIRLMSSSIN